MRRLLIIQGAGSTTAEIELGEANPWWADPGQSTRIRQLSDWSGPCSKGNRGTLPLRCQRSHLHVARAAARQQDHPAHAGDTAACQGRGRAASSILYYSFDTESRPADVYATVVEYLAMGGASGRRFLFFDEITGIKNWHKAVKKLVDRGRLENCTVVVTGSWSADMARSAYQLCDRRIVPKGGLSDAVLEPMSFGEYVQGTTGPGQGSGTRP